MRLSALLTREPPPRRPLARRDRSIAVPSEAAQLPAHADAPRIIAPFVRLPLLADGTQQRESRRPSPLALSFVALVMVPIVVAATYLFIIAADQYVAEFRFSLNSIDAPRIDPLSLLAGNASHSPAGLESQIIVQYITSRAILDELDGTLDVRRMFSPPEADWWARLPRPTSIEALVQYWRGQVDPFYDPANGTVVVRVRAFAPADALQLAQAIVARKSWSTSCRRGRGTIPSAMPKLKSQNRKPASKRRSARSAPFAIAKGSSIRAGAPRRPDRSRHGCATSWSAPMPSSPR